MPVLKNQRHEYLAQIAVQRPALKWDEIAKLAGYSSKSNACKAAASPAIAKRIRELKERGAEKSTTRAAVTVDTMTDQLLEDRALAHRVEQPGAAVSASMGIAKIHGLDVQKHEHFGPGGGPIEFVSGFSAAKKD